MKCTMITTWELLDGVDFDLTLERVTDRRLPALKDLGADRVVVIRTSDRTIAAISEWPDRRTRDTAYNAIKDIRAKVKAEDHARMTGEMAGDVVAEI